MNIIDRRLNPKGKSLANRQRFLRRAKEQIVKAVRDSSGKRNIQDIENGDKISISTGGVREPAFHRSALGRAARACCARAIKSSSKAIPFQGRMVEAGGVARKAPRTETARMISGSC